MSSAPPVSCVMPAYNYERFIAQAIESALAQDYPSDALEIIVVDDGSTDGTPEAVAPYRDRVRYIRKENGGINSAVNRALEEATGTYIAFLDADDMWPPDKTARQVEFLEANPHVGLLHGDMEIIDADDEIVAPSFFQRLNVNPVRGRVLGPLLIRNFVSGGAVMMRAGLKGRYYPLPPDTAWTDWWFAFRIAPVADIDHLPEPIYRYRYHGDNTLFMAQGERLTRLLRDKEIPWRRWMLTHVEPDEAPIGDLINGWRVLDQIIQRVASDLGTEPAEVVERRPGDDVRAHAALERMRAALDAGDAAGVACHLVAALAHDPHDSSTRLRFDNFVRALEEALGAPGPEPQQGEDPPSGRATASLEARAFVTAAFADEIAERPQLLSAYAGAFDGADDATLLLYAPGWTAADISERLGGVVAGAGLDADSAADVLAYPCAPASTDPPIRVHAVLSSRPTVAPFEAPAFDESRTRELRGLAERSLGGGVAR